MNTFTIKGLFKEAWKDYKKYWGVILLIGLTFAIVQSFGFSGMNFDPYTGTLTQGGFGQLIGWIAGTWLSIGYLNFLLNIVDGNQANYKDIFYGVKSAEQFAYFVLVSLIYGAAVVLGLFILIIPGIILAIGFLFAQYYIAENRLGFTNAFKSSWEITKGNRWKIFGFGIVAGLFNVLGLIALGVGLLITIPMTQLMYARMFRKLEGIPLPEENEETIVEETHSEE
jgi:hypothetical protein